jgi:uncharacterized membrane protein
MSTLILGLIVFLGSHSISIVAPAWRDSMVQRLGLVRWQIAYALVSFIGFYLIVRGYSLARLSPTVLYVPPVGLRHVAALLMLPVFPLLFAAYLPGRIRDAAKHPMLAATKFWALAHLLANGMLADVLLFGGVLAWAVADRISLGKRGQRPIRTAPRGRWNDAIAVVLGLVVYVAFIRWLHLAWFGVAPMS